MLNWLRKKFAARAGYKAGYKRGRKLGLQAAGAEAIAKTDAMLADAKQQAASVVAAGHKHRDRLVAGAREAIDKAADVAREVAHAAGYRDGIETGRMDGERLAYHERARELGLVVQPGDELPQREHQLEQVHLGPHANIYHEECSDGGFWVVRLIYRGELGRADFEWERRSDKSADTLRALCKAIAYRNRYSTSTGDRQIVDRLLQPFRGPAGFSFDHVLQVCRDYHREAASVDASLLRQQPIWVGDAPEARFHLSDPTIVARPWESLWDGKPVPDVWCDAMTVLGLADRTLRDLLLFEASEFDACSGIGAAMLRQLRTRLAARKLYLWGEGPVIGAISHPARERHDRSIELDGWSETDLDGRQTAT